MAHFFPLNPPSQRAEEPPTRRLTARLPTTSLYEPTDAVEGETPPLLPAQDHTVYNSQDVLGCLPEDYELVLELAGQWAGVGKESVGVMVERFERRLGRWVEQEKHSKRQDEKKSKSKTKKGVKT